MKGKVLRIKGCFDRLNVTYDQITDKLFYYIAYYDNVKTEAFGQINLDIIIDNQVVEPSREDLENYIYQTAFDRLYDLEDSFGNKKYRF